MPHISVQHYSEKCIYILNIKICKIIFFGDITMPLISVQHYSEKCICILNIYIFKCSSSSFFSFNFTLHCQFLIELD